MDENKILELVIPFDEENKIDDLVSILKQTIKELELANNSSHILTFNLTKGYITQVQETKILKKKCNKCGKLYDATTEYFNKYNKFPGLYPTCKACINKEQEIKYKEKKEKERKEQEKLYKELKGINEETIKTKKCCRCGEIKPIDSFYKNSRSKDKRESACIECDKLRRKNLKEKKQKGGN